MSNLHRIGIIGEGKMGTNIFQYLSGFDLQLIWLCSREAGTDKLRRTFLKKISRSREAGIISEEQYLHLEGSTRISDDPRILSSCDLVIESVTEDLDLKKSLFREIDPLINENCIFASNSSSINPSRLIPSERREDKFIGLHFFYPVQLKNILEVILTDKTSPSAREDILVLTEKIGRNAIFLNEKSSFILNRIFLDVQNEAFLIAGKGKVDFRQIDSIVMKEHFPSGIFTFFDSVGIDTMLASIRNYIADYPHIDYYTALARHLEGMVSEGRLGKKSGEGFYRKEQGPADAIIPDPLLAREVIERLKLAYVASAKRFALQSHLSLSEVNDAMTEYLGTTLNLLK